MSAKPIPTEYRRKLPHIQPEQAVFFVTFNLKGALPKHIVLPLKEEYTSIINDFSLSGKRKTIAFNNYNEQIGELLDCGRYGYHWLKEPDVAQIVADSLHYLDGKEFKLVCYSIMSNHVHFIAYKLKKPLFKIIHSLKSFTAHGCNKKLDRTGSFWQREYFDRVVRDRNDLAVKIDYVVNNPVKAGLVDRWDKYQFSFCRKDFLEI